MLVSVRGVAGGPRKWEENEGPPIFYSTVSLPPSPSPFTPAAVENGFLFLCVFSRCMSILKHHKMPSAFSTRPFTFKTPF